jgi:hypothetical protein
MAARFLYCSLIILSSCIEPRLVGRQHLLRFSMPFKDICTTIKAENVVLNFLPSPIIMVKMLLKGASTTFRLPFFLLLLLYSPQFIMYIVDFIVVIHLPGILFF